MSDQNWERIQREKLERLKRIQEENSRRQRAMQLEEQEESMNDELKKKALEHLSKGGKSEDLFYKEKPKLVIGVPRGEGETEVNQKLKDTAKSVRKGFRTKQDDEDAPLMDKIRKKLGF
jgi:hypothetical protein